MTRQQTTEPTEQSPTTAETTAQEKPATAPAEATPSLAEQLAAAKAEAASHYDRYVRAMADQENFRKRVAREKDELRQYAASRVLEDLMPVLDNLGHGLAAAALPGAEVKSLREGIVMVQTQLKNTLEQHGLKEINPVGQAFDAHQHEAISQQPSAEVPEGNVLNVIRVGYALNGRLLRAASVVVSSGAPKAEEKQ